MIKEEQLGYEKEHLRETKQWLEDAAYTQGNEEQKLLDKIGKLKKASKGKYNEELETEEKIYNIVHKNLERYRESIEQPYFARIDFREYRKKEEVFYIGKFGLGDMTKGEELVIDWRAPIADLYYSGTQGDAYYRAPIGVVQGELSLKRKFLFDQGDIKDIFDEGINEIILKNTIDDSGENALIDEFLKINLEQSTGRKLKEVVATIQKEQNEIIRAEKNAPIIVQGSAGSGKTTVALHRLAYLLYRYKEKLDGQDILVIAPNKLFLDYISEVLPTLGVGEVKQKTFEDFAIDYLKLKGKLYSKDKKLQNVLENEDSEEVKYITNSSKIKGSMVFKSIMDRFLLILERESSNMENITIQGFTIFEKTEIKRLYVQDMKHMPINKRKDEIKRYFSLKLNEKLMKVIEKIDFQYEYQISRIKKQMDDCQERRQKLIEIYDERDSFKNKIRTEGKSEFDAYFDNWKGIDTKNLYKRLFKEELFDELVGGVIPKKLWNYIVEVLENDDEQGVIDSDDIAPLLYLKLMVEGVSDDKKYKHIVIDEAQDYSPLQMCVASMLALGNSMTIVGDLGQGIYYYKGIDQWEKLIDDVFKGGCTYIPLSQSYRSTIEIIEFANKVLKKQKNNLKPATPVLRHGEEPEVIQYENNNDFAKETDAIVNRVINSGKNSVAIIGRTFEECKKIRDIMKKNSMYDWTLIKEADKNIKLDKIIIPSYLTKGLEFDCSIVFNCNDKIYRDNELDKKLLYVVLTRALHYQFVFYNGTISSLLSDD